MAHTSRQYAARKDATGQSKPSTRTNSTGGSEHRSDAELLADAARSAAAAKDRLGIIGMSAAERRERRRDAQEARELAQVARDKARLANIARLDAERAEQERHRIDASQAEHAKGRALRTRDGESSAQSALDAKIAQANAVYDQRDAQRAARKQHNRLAHHGPAPR